MAVLPAEIPTGLVTGQFYFVSADLADANTDPEMEAVTGVIRFTSSAPVLRMPAYQATLVPLRFDAKLNAKGELVSADDPSVGVKLPATDSESINPTDFTWQVDFLLSKATNGHTIKIPGFAIKVPEGETTDLTEVMPIAVSPGVQIIQGAPGRRGPEGAASTVPGPANKLTIGTVTKADTPSATITGTAPAQVLNLALPKGDTGVPAGGTSGQLVRKTSNGVEWVSPTKSLVGLDKADNTADADKPVSNAQKAALDLKANISDLKAFSADAVQDWVRAGLAASVTSPFRIMFLGDSQTNDGTVGRTPEGITVWGGQTGYSNRLANLLSKNGMKQAQAGVAVSTNTAPGVHSWSAAVAGQTAGGYVPTGVLNNIQTIAPHLVFHMIGTNDDSQQTTPAAYKANLKAAIDGVWARVPNARQVVIICWPKRPAGATYQWEQYAQAQRDLVAEYRVAGNDKVTLFDYGVKFNRLGGGVLTSWSVAFPDGIHGSRALHRELTEELCAWMGLPSPMAMFGAGEIIRGVEPFLDGTAGFDRMNPISKVDIPAAPVPRSLKVHAAVLMVANAVEPELYLRPLVPGTATLVEGMEEMAVHFAAFTPWTNKEIKGAWEILPPNTAVTMAFNKSDNAARVYGGAGYNVYNQLWAELAYV